MKKLLIFFVNLIEAVSSKNNFYSEVEHNQGRSFKQSNYVFYTVYFSVLCELRVISWIITIMVNISVPYLHDGA